MIYHYKGHAQSVEELAVSPSKNKVSCISTVVLTRSKGAFIHACVCVCVLGIFLPLLRLLFMSC